jgi:hypothetical protein
MKNDRKKDKQLAKLDEEAAKVEARAAKKIEKAMKEDPGKCDEKITKVGKEHKRELVKIEEEHEKVTKRLWRNKETIKNMIRRSRKARRAYGLWSETLTRPKPMKRKKGEGRLSIPVFVPIETDSVDSSLNRCYKVSGHEQSR